MVNVQIGYNPYTVKTSILLNGKTIENKVSPLMYVINKRLQEWIEPKGSWPGIFKALRASTGEKQIEIEFTGTFGDFEDLAYAKDKFGNLQRVSIRINLAITRTLMYMEQIRR